MSAFMTCHLIMDPPGDGGFPIQIGGSFLYNTYPDVSYMYPECILHVFRCVLSRYIKIHQDTSRYICICHFGYDDGIETFPQPPRYVSCMYPACIPHVSRMCPACILITTEDTCIPHVSRMYPACIPHVSLHIRYISLRMHLRYMYLTMYLTMYLGCILYVS
jgi:hypothetical protein